MSVEKALEYYRSQPDVEYVEPDYFAKVASTSSFDAMYSEEIMAVDPLFTSQWGLHNTGQSGGTIDSDINAPETWLVENGSTAPVIGIIDSGVDYNHNDLNANLWRNPGETAGNGIDDDANGYIDDVYGINAITGTGNPFDDFHHGTRVAGIIGAVGDNGLGISGVMQVANIASCKFLNNVGTGSASDAIECMQYFINLKTRINNPQNIVAINNSWILNTKSQATQDAIAELRNHGIIFVAAAGNLGTNNDVTASYPANYAVSNVVSVAATDRADARPSFSNYGKATVHLAAPGSAILSTIPNQGFGTSSGSSLAAPHVTGMIGLLAANNSALTWWELKNYAIAGGEILPNLQTITMSSRRLRGVDTGGVGSLSCVDQIVKARMEPLNQSLLVAKNSPILLKALHVNCQTPNGDVTVYSDGTTTITLADGGVDGDDVAGDGEYALNWVPTVAGNYNLDFGNGDVVSLRVYDPSIWHGYDVTIDGTFTSETITGTSLGAGNEIMVTLASPFPILFGGDATGFNNLYITSNGTVSVTDAVLVSGVNSALPIASPATMIGVFWDDLTFTQAGAAIYYQVLGTAPNRKLVVEWRNFKHFNASGTGTVQIIFYENSANFRTAYKDTDLGSATYNYGNSATTGVQLSNSQFTQYSHLKPSVPSNRSLLFSLQP